ncbi:MAG: hypothetical protein RLZZ361_112 [Cyanobacteriota bacterium]|jgi:hypothetical protein
MKKTIKLSKKLLGAALALGLGTTLVANAMSTPQPASGTDAMLTITEMPTHPTLLSNDDHECGESQCGEDGGDGEGGGDEHDEMLTPAQ